MSSATRGFRFSSTPIQTLNIGGVLLFRPQWTPRYQPGFASSKILADRDHPLHIRYQRNYDQATRDTLWWHVTPNILASANVKKVVRSWCKRRTATAFVEALKEKGLDNSGRRIFKNEAGDIVEAVPFLQGTLTLQPRQEAITAEWLELKNQAVVMLDFLSRLQSRQSKWPKRTTDR